MERDLADSRWIRTTFFFSVRVVSCKLVSTGGSRESAFAARSRIWACSTSAMTMLTTASLENDLPATPAPTGSERKMNPSDVVNAPRANSLDVEGEAKDPDSPGFPQTSVATIQGPSTM